MKSEVMCEANGHQWIVCGRDPSRRDEVIDTNEFILKTAHGSVLFDPGGIEIFPSVLSEVTRHVALADVRVIVASHQDPDIVSSLPMWLDLCPNVRVFAPWMWVSFLTHFCMGRSSAIDPIPDEGMRIAIGNSQRTIEAVPAHYCHSSGNFSFFDPATRVLFSGDIGAALLPEGHDEMYVREFDQHIQYMEGFHRRWMPSSRALRAWVRRARALKPSMICPQHGAIFKGEDVGRILDWLEQLEVGKCAALDEAEDENALAIAS